MSSPVRITYVEDGYRASVVDFAAYGRRVTARGTALRRSATGKPALSTTRLSAGLLTVHDAPTGYLPDFGAASTIALFCGDRATNLTQTLVEAHFVRPGANQILEQNIRCHASPDDARASFDEASRAAEAFVTFTSGGSDAGITVTRMPVPNDGDETFAIRLAAAKSLTAVAADVRLGRLQITVLIAGGLVDPRLLTATTRTAVTKARGIRQ